MENKEILITIAIIAVLTYFYWQNQQNTLNIQPEPSPELAEAKELQAQVNHYQKLYQQRVEKDLENQEYPKMLEKKINDLETALLNLAKQKNKGKKDAERLVNELETNWQQDKETWQAEQKRLLANCETNYNLAQSQLTQLKNYQSEQAKFQQELATKKNWGESHIPQLKQELFTQGQGTFEQLKEMVDKAWFTKGGNVVKQKLEDLEEFFKSERERESKNNSDNKVD